MLWCQGYCTQLIYSYLKDRTQYVSFGSSSSSLSKIKCGVPQGSILGPLLFMLYINDLCNVSKFLKFVLFADDTNLFTSGRDIESLCEVVNVELAKINLWFKLNKLSLNISKTNFIIFSNVSLHHKSIGINIEGVNIVRVFETKFLGVIIDHKLNWKDHIRYIRGKLNRCMSMMYKASEILDTVSLRCLSCIHYLPYISYCCENWGTPYRQTLQSIITSKKGYLDL